MPTIAETLLKAASVVETRGLFRGDLTGCLNVYDYDAGYDPDDETTWPVDMLGAINVATGRQAGFPYEGGPPSFDDRIPVVQALVKHLGGNPDVEFPDYFLSEWCDAEGRTAADVVAVFRECAGTLVVT